MSRSLHDYQIEMRDNLSRFLKTKKSVVAQLATGGGKTVLFADISSRFVSQPNNRVLIVVHKEELLMQARKTIYEWHGIVAEAYIAGMSGKPKSPVVITMVETMNNRLKKDPTTFDAYNLWIVDECHIGNFTKVYEHCKGLRIGFSATPLAASKKNPLKNFYEGIVCGPPISELISRGALLPNCTRRQKLPPDLSSLTRSNGGISSNGDFNLNMMGECYSKGKHVVNTVDQYKEKSFGRKTIVFNCNVKHSLLVTAAFNQEGIPCQHLDGSMKDYERADVINWYRNTHNAVLCNVNVATTGFDDPGIYHVMVNRDTLSLPLWLQMGGRGGRIHHSMDHFMITDMGRNEFRFGDWSADRDWTDMFWNPGRPSDGSGIAPVMECPNEACGCLIHPSSRFCKWCGEEIPREMQLIGHRVEFEETKSANPININIPRLIQENPGVSEWQDLHLIKNKIIAHARSNWAMHEGVTDHIAQSMYNTYVDNVKAWCKQKGRTFNAYMKDNTRLWFYDSLKSTFGYEESKN